MLSQPAALSPGFVEQDTPFVKGPHVETITPPSMKMYRRRSVLRAPGHCHDCPGFFSMGAHVVASVGGSPLVHRPH